MSHEIYLFVALAVMAIGPLLVTVLKRIAWSSTILDGFVFASITGIVLFHILPESISNLGWISILIGAAGLFTPNLIEKASAFKKIPAHSAILLALLAIMIHTWLDGVAMGAAKSVQGSSSLSIAIILHRLPVGVGLWWLIRPRWGKRGAWIVIIVLSISTITGFLFAPIFKTYVQDSILIGLQTFVAGSLFHVVLHDAFDSNESGAASRWAELAGVMLGAAVIISIPFFDPHVHEHSENTAHYGDTFLHLVIESAPALLVGYLLAGLMAVFVQKMPTRWLNRGPNLLKALKGTAIGLPVPVCSCGVVPIYKGLIKSGVGAPAAMAFMVATPELGIDALLLSIPLLGPKLAFARVIGAFSVAILVGVIVGSMIKDREPEQEEKIEGDKAHWLKIAFNKGFVEIVDETAPWIVLGIAIAAFFGPGLSLDFITDLPPHSDVIIFSLIGIPIYVCASGSTPLAAALIFAGASPGAAIAFLLAGPATNVTTFGILTQMHSKKVSIMFGAIVVVLAILFGIATNLVMGDVVSEMMTGHHHKEETWWQWVALGGLGVIFLGSIIRLGPRGFIANLSPGGHHNHSHGHSHDHSHNDSDDHCCGH